MTSPCSAVGCWVTPALPAQTMPVEPIRRVAFALPPDAVVTGIATAPDPYPPRFTFHA
jgi:hypothetical protein